MIDEQGVFGLLLNRAGDALHMIRSENQLAENQQIQCSLQQRDAFCSDLAFDIY